MDEKGSRWKGWILPVRLEKHQRSRVNSCLGQIQQSCEMTPPDPTPGHQVIFIKRGVGGSGQLIEAGGQQTVNEAMFVNCSAKNTSSWTLV